MTEAASLEIWSDDAHVATIAHQARDDVWQLEYTRQWREFPEAFALCPSLPLEPGRPAVAYQPASIKRFLENLLPEGHALDTIAASNNLSKNNIFGLIRAIGTETTGAFRFVPAGRLATDRIPENPPRLITAEELNERILQQANRPLAEWDGKVRMSIAGIQSKLAVYLHPGSGGNFPYLFLPDHPLASSHILKPEPEQIPFMAVNEHFCMSLAKHMGLPVAEVDLLSLSDTEILSVRRFDRRPAPAGTARIASDHLPPGEALQPLVRTHIIDACQAFDFPVSYKYEHNFGSSRDVAQIRDGMSLPRLFHIARQYATIPASAKRTLSQWVLIQLLIGNYDAHGKNFSFHVTPAGLQPAPWYDLVSVAQYPKFSSELAMAVGDAFTLGDITPLELAQFAESCDIQRRFLEREAARLCAATRRVAQPLLDSMPYSPAQRQFAQRIVDFVLRQAAWLETTAKQAAKVSPDMLNPFNPSP